eukprot:TRINITY_DN5197_c0_g2_i2.p1 TRINITY_DN5197_c0_g2~~TRINITY_DN5197_c0_g2_i2.p1  ORF type:complete len:133 (-),score=25.14 TRINITY_DN5197_c0_g2_i2:74-472(-)
MCIRDRNASLPATVWNTTVMDDDLVTSLRPAVQLYVYAVDVSQKQEAISNMEEFVNTVQGFHYYNNIAFVGVNADGATGDLFSADDGLNFVSSLKQQTGHSGYSYHDWIANEDVHRLLLPLTVGITHYLNNH